MALKKVYAITEDYNLIDEAAARSDKLFQIHYPVINKIESRFQNY